MSQLCKMLDIKPIRTSPYHPETDGLLERWHSDLLAMLKKATIDKKDWDLYLPFVLFAYRQTPHTVTGFSQFQLIYGFNVRGPLEILRDNWVDGCVAETTLIDWVEQLKMNLMDFSVIAGDRSALAKCKMKVLYDKSSKPNTSFSPGSMVLVRTPGFSAKFSDSWEGPFEVLRQVTPVTWEISIPNSPRKKRIVHVNMLNEWHTAKVLVCRVVVLEEETPNIYSNSLAKNLTKEQFTQLHEVQKSFGSLLTDTPGSTSLTEIAIITGDAPPFQSCPYRIPSALLNSVRLSLDTLMEEGIIEPSHSPWSSPMIPVKKKDGSVRICIDFRRLNAVTTPDPYLMPRIDDIIDCLGNAKFLSKFDLAKGFHQVPVRECDRIKTAFVTPWGKYQYRYMPFGLRNAPATFQRLMDVVLHDVWYCCQAYIDDIVVFSSSWEDHCSHLAVVLKKLQDAGLTLKTSKCEWGVATCTYLGLVVGQGKRKPDECKVDAIRSFLKPHTKSQVRSFLGLTGYYRDFVPAYASNSYHLTESTKKSAPETVSWTTDMNKEFLYLRDCLCSAPCLSIPLPSDSFCLHTDASGLGIGAVLSVTRARKEHPVAYYSRKLSKAERNYSATELEGLAVVASIQHFSVYLYGVHFVVVTDHRALSFLSSSKLQPGRLARWALLLQEYNFSVKYRPGSQNGNADALSRLCQTENHDLRSLEEGGDVVPQH